MKVPVAVALLICAVLFAFVFACSGGGGSNRAENDDDNENPTPMIDDDATDDDQNDDDSNDDDGASDDDADDDATDDDTSDRAVIVGGSEETGPIVWVRENQTWSLMLVPNAPSIPFVAVDAYAEDGAFMVAENSETAIVYQYQGTYVINRGFACENCRLQGVAAQGEYGVFLAGHQHSGDNTFSRIWKRAGVTFTQMELSQPNVYDLSIATDVAFIDGAQAVAVGYDSFSDDGILWLGSNEVGFTPQELPYVSGHWRLDAVAVCGNGDIVAVGNNFGENRGLILMGSEGDWKVQALPSISDDWELHDVTCAGNHATVVGKDNQFGRGLILSSVGGWYAQVVPDISNDWGLRGVAMSGDGTGYAVGYDVDNGLAVILRRENNTWQTENAPIFQRTQPLYGVSVLRNK